MTQAGGGPRVLHVSECLIGGTASYVEEIAPAQIDRFGAGNIGLLAPESLMADFPRITGLERFAYKQDQRSPAAIARLARAMRRTVRAFRPDIVHLHSTIAGAVGRIALNGVPHRPRIIYCAHGWMIDPDRETRHQHILMRLERLLARRADRIVNISPHETRFLRDMAFDPSRMSLIVSGIRDAPPMPRLPSADGVLRLLFIGRLDRQKGFDLLAAAMKRVPPGRVRLTVIGAPLKAVAEPEAIDASIDFLGWQSRDVVAQAIGAADAVVMPSRWEGLPLVALETMRAGRAVIATNGGAFTAMIDHGRTGVLVDNRNPDFLTDVLARFDIEDFHRMGAAARERFVTEYQLDRMNRDLLALYDDLVRA